MKKVLILHGWMHSAKVYGRLKEDLERLYDCAVIAYEFPGFGNMPAKYYSKILNNYVEDTRSILRTVDFDLIIAHSMGGNIVLKAISGLSIKAKVILLSPAYGGIRAVKPLLPLYPFMRLAANVLKYKCAATDTIIRVLCLLTIRKWNDIPDAIIDAVRKSNSKVAIRLLFELAYDKWRTDRYSGEILLVAGEYDRIISAKSIEKLMIDAEISYLIILSGIGHTAVIEAYSELLNIIVTQLIN